MSGFDLSELDRDVARLATLESVEDVMEVYGLVLRLGQEARRLKKLMDEQMLEYIHEHGSFDHAGVRYYSGKKKKWIRVHDPATTLDRVANMADGDLETVARCMSASQSAWKHGEIRELERKLGIPVVDSLYRCEEVPDLKTGKTKRETKKIPAPAGER